MAVPVVVSVTVTDQHSSGPSTTLTVNMPDIRPDNDVFIACCMKDDDPNWTVIPSNWFDILTVINNQERLRCWYWIGSSEPESYSLTMDNEIGVAIVLHITGADLANVLNVTAVTSNGSSANAQAPQITPDDAETLIITAVANDSDDVEAVPSGMSVAAIGGDGGAGDVGFGVAYEDGPAASVATTMGTWTFVTDTWGAGTMAISAEVQKTNEATVSLSEVVMGEGNSYSGPYEI